MIQTASTKDYMTTDVITVTPEMSIHAAIRVLVDKQISSMPVVDENGNLVGILTTRDCLNVAFSASYHKDSGGRVTDYMSENVETIDAGCDIVEVAGLFLKSHYRRFPVTANDRLVGLISRYDVLRALADLW
ncbi:MAG: CBS domain-containing protein [Proteobacteria bacterium]|nr:CBS domain-containing protein [Pseudomonadota bacterium]